MRRSKIMTAHSRRSQDNVCAAGQSPADLALAPHSPVRWAAAALIILASCVVNRSVPARAAPLGENPILKARIMKAEVVESFREAVVAGDLATVDALLQESPDLAAIKDENGVAILLLALYLQKTDVAARIAAARDSFDIFEAAAMGKLANVRSCLDADPDALGAYSADGFTPLHLATFFGKMEVVRFILANGGDVDAIARNDSKVRPIHSAAATRDARMLRVILAAGADPDTKQTGGHTALHSAALHGNVPMTIALLAAGADPAMQNDERKSAIDLDAQANSGTIKNLLRSRSAMGNRAFKNPPDD